MSLTASTAVAVKKTTKNHFLTPNSVKERRGEKDIELAILLNGKGAHCETM
jgi:hypothetical protein